jgi:hypothetical protein
MGRRQARQAPQRLGATAKKKSKKSTHFPLTDGPARWHNIA